MKEIEDAVEMINDMHNGRHYLDESVKSVITNLYSLKTLQQPNSCKSCRFYHSYTGVCANDKCPLCADFVNSDFGCIHYDAKDEQ